MMRGFRRALLCICIPSLNSNGDTGYQPVSPVAFGLARVKFDHEAFVQRRRQLGALRHGLEGALGSLHINTDPLRETARVGGFESSLRAQMTASSFGQFDHVTGTDRVRRDIYTLAVDQHAVVTDDLARLCARGAEAHAIGNGVQTRLKQLQQVFAGLTLLAFGFCERATELTFEHAVGTADLLLLTQLLTIARQAGAGLLAVLAGSIAAALDGALIGKALFALEEQLLALTAALTALGIKIT